MTYTMAVCTVKKTPDDRQRNCPKHVVCYSKNKFEKLVHLVGFIIKKLSSYLLRCTMHFYNHPALPNDQSVSTIDPFKHCGANCKTLKQTPYSDNKASGTE